MEPAGSGATWTGSPKGVFAGRKHHKPRQGVVTSTLNAFRGGAVGFIDWLGRKTSTNRACGRHKKVWDGASNEVGAPENRIHGRSHTRTRCNKDLESSTWVETAPLTEGWSGRKRSRGSTKSDMIRRRILRSNVQDETRAGERADDLNLGKMRSGGRAMRTKVNSRALSLSAG